MADDFHCRDCGQPMTRDPDDQIAWECVPCDSAVWFTLGDADRTALSAAAFELKERRKFYEERLATMSATDRFVAGVDHDIKACDAAIAVCERLCR